MKPKSATKRWTIMVYMAGDNNLDPEGVQDLKEMKRVGSTDKVNVVAQFDRASGHVARRYYIRKGGIVTGDAVESLGEVNTGDPNSLTDFIQWTHKNYPAQHYMLVLWNHGQGWDDTDIFEDERYRQFRRLATGRISHALFHTPVRKALKTATKDMQVRAILLDDNAKDFLDNQEMKKVLSGARKVLRRKLDILGMDACLMSMAEVGYQVAGSTAYTVASEQTEPGEGWPYDTILAALVKKPGMTPRDLSTLIVDKYLASYTRRDEVTCSACDMSKAPSLGNAVARLASTLKASLNIPQSLQAIQLVRSMVQSYEVKDNIDLVDFCSLLAKEATDPKIGSACQGVIKAVKDKYVFREGYRGTKVSNSYGVAIYFPLQEVSPLYAKLEFSKRTGWNAFLKAYLAAIERGRSRRGRG